VICLSHLIKLNYLTIIYSLLQDLSTKDCQITIFDLTSHEIDSDFDKWNDDRVKILDTFYRFVLQLDCDITLVSFALKTVSHETDRHAENIVWESKNLRAFQEMNYLSPLENLAVRSFFATHELRTLDDLNSLSTFAKRLLKDLVVEMFFVSRAFRELLRLFQPEVVLVQNGRWRSQTSIIAVSNEQNIEVMFFNTGPRINDTFFLSNYMLQDTNAHQTNFAKSNILDAFEEMTKKKYISDWLTNNQKVSDRFHEIDDSDGKVIDETEAKSLPPRKLASIFVSTATEYDFFSKEKSSLHDQTEAICEIIALLQSLGFQVVIRMHPNQQNYSFRDFYRMLREIKKLADVIILPWDLDNSYHLFSSSDLVIVWQSTIGLEAWVSGKFVICLENTYYNTIAKVPTATSKIALEQILEQPLKLCQIEDAFSTLHYLHNYGGTLALAKNESLAKLKSELDSFIGQRKKAWSRSYYAFSEDFREICISHKYPGLDSRRNTLVAL